MSKPPRVTDAMIDAAARCIPGGSRDIAHAALQAGLAAATGAQTDPRDVEIERLRDAIRLAKAFRADVNRLEHEAESAECVAMALDKAGVPKDDGKGNTYSLWGRVRQFAATAAQPEPQCWRALAQRCLTAMESAIHFRETGQGRPPEQTCMAEVEELRAMLKTPK
jgi:hypothetical protein